MAQRALLLDKDNELVAHPSFAEIDDYMERGLVERLTPVKAKTHVFRLIDRSKSDPEVVVDVTGFDESSLSASTSKANAGEVDAVGVMWARRRVKIWPFIGDTRAPRVGIRQPTKFASIAQTVERRFCKPLVAGATPARCSN